MTTPPKECANCYVKDCFPTNYCDGCKDGSKAKESWLEREMKLKDIKDALLQWFEDDAGVNMVIALPHVNYLKFQLTRFFDDIKELPPETPRY